MSALAAVSSNISGSNSAAFSVIDLESTSSYVNQSIEAVTSAMNEFSSLQMNLQTNMVCTFVLHPQPTYTYVRTYTLSYSTVHCCASMHVDA